MNHTPSRRQPMLPTRTRIEGFPFYVVFLAALTLAYLLIEVPFAGYLVTLLGSEASAEAVERAEQAGRIISGCALALAVWGVQIPSRIRRCKNLVSTVLACALSGALCVSGVYYGEKALIDFLVEELPSSVRQQAVLASVVRDGFFVSTPDFVGMDIPAKGTESGSWMAFRGLFPFLSLADTNVIARSGLAPGPLIQQGALKRLPGADDFEAAYDAVVETTQTGWESFAEIAAAYRKVYAEVTNRLDDAWRRNMQAVAQYGVKSTETRAGRSIRARVQQEVPVPDNWSLWDKPTFYEAGYRRHLSSARDRYQDAVERLLRTEGAQLPVALSQSEFFAHETVQKAVRRDLRLDGPVGFALGAPLSADRLARLHAAYLEQASARLTSAMTRISPVFDEGEEFELLGEAALRAAIVPILALGLSLAGAMGHVLKLVNQLAVIALHLRPSRIGVTRFLRKHGFVRLLLVVASSAGIMLGSYVPAQAITESEYYRDVSGRVRTSMGEPVERGIEWTISWQRALMPASQIAAYAGLFGPLQGYLEGHAGVESVVVSSPVVVEAAAGDVPMPRRRPLGR